MENHIVKIISIGHITHNVVQIFTEEPQQLDFTPGQAVEISINKDGWQDEKIPFTFTSLPNDDYLQFTIKTYPAHIGVTNEFLQFKKNDELFLHDVFEAIIYKNEGVFIAESAGATIIEGVNYSDYEEKIKEAAENCPVDVIKYTE